MNESRTHFTFLFPLSKKEKNSLVKVAEKNNVKLIENNSFQESSALECLVNDYNVYYRNFSSRNMDTADLATFFALLTENEKLTKKFLNPHISYDDVRQKYLSFLCAQKELIEQDIEQIKKAKAKNIITISGNINRKETPKLKDYDTVVANKEFKRIATIVTGAFIIGIIILIIKLFIS